MNNEIAEELQRDLDQRRTRRAFAEGRGPNSVSEAYALQRALRIELRDSQDLLVAQATGVYYASKKKSAS